MDIHPGGITECTIDGTGSNGEGVAHINGLAVFIPAALPGETVRAEVTLVKKNFAAAKVIKILKTSPDRAVPLCAEAFRCGGCAMQHIKYDAQLKIKKRIVEDCLVRQAKLNVKIDDVVPSPEVFHCRNKMQIPVEVVNGQATAGFYREKSHKIVPVTSCVLSGEKTNLIMREAVSLCGGSLRHIIIRNAGEQYMLILVSRTPHVDGIEKLVRKLFKLFPKISVYVNVNDKDTNVITGDKYTHIAGPEVLTGVTCGIKYELSPNSFAQVNDGVRDLVYMRVKKEICCGIVIDAYSGIGIMTALAAKAQCEMREYPNEETKIYGIEIVADAVKDAGRIAQINGFQDKIINIHGDCAEELPKLLRNIRNNLLRAEHCTLILDPPRKGCDEKVLNAVLSSLPDKIIYISCNPATLARDLSKFEAGYVIKEVTPYDMFPQTRHVECLAILNKK